LLSPGNGAACKPLGGANDNARARPTNTDKYPVFFISVFSQEVFEQQFRTPVSIQEIAGRNNSTRVLTLGTHFHPRWL
jgi:hypothetical protein